MRVCKLLFCVKLIFMLRELERVLDHYDAKEVREKRPVIRHDSYGFRDDLCKRLGELKSLEA